jgi:dTDP-glucose 4,6-dehydratase/UDP-glucuronate decarboxylase
MSSGEIYGNPPPEYIPTPEEYNGNTSSLSPRACYIESKRLCESLCLIYLQKFGVPTKIARPFIVYGPGMELADRRVLADFIRQGMEGSPISMLTPGKDTRSYCYISDATVAFFRLLFSERNNAGPFNIASDREEVSIRELAETIHKIFGITKAVIAPSAGQEEVSFLKNAPQRVVPDIKKLREAFGYEPKIILEEGLRRTINWNLLRIGKKPL